MLGISLVRGGGVFGIVQRTIDDYYATSPLGIPNKASPAVFHGLLCSMACFVSWPALSHGRYEAGK